MVFIYTVYNIMVIAHLDPIHYGKAMLDNLMFLVICYHLGPLPVGLRIIEEQFCIILKPKT